MGEVYLAMDLELQRKVALKFLSDELLADNEGRERLLREARAASALNHPHICTVYAVGEEAGRWYIAMGYVEGRPLNEIIANGPLPAERIGSYGVQIADAIAHAHSRGVIHRDLKSANIMVTPEGRARVLDFGLAVRQGVEADSATQSRVTSAESGMVSGTLPYMAPEILRGQPADERSDIWALGVILYEMASGRQPFQGETAFELTSSILKDSATLPSEVPAGLRAIIQRCMSKSPGERYQSAAEVRAALEAVQSATSEAPVVVEAPAAESRPNWFTRAWVGAVAVVVILGFLWSFSGRGRGGGESGMGGLGAEGLAIGSSGRPSLAVLNFVDRTGSERDAWLASGVPSMLQTGLAQTAGLDVVSSGRIHEIMVQLGEERIEDLDLATLGEIARRSGAGAVVVGAVYAAGSDYRIDVQVEDVDTGRVIAAHTATGPDVFALVDDLAARVRGGLELEPAPDEAGIAEITTDSLEAWRHFDEGLKAQQNLRHAAARDSFLRAVELDPEFALAHAHLFLLNPWLVDPASAAEHERIVLENLERLPERDRSYFLAGVPWRSGDPARAAELYEELIDRYPDFEDAYIALSLLYGGILREPSRALELLGQGVQANPSSGHLRNQYGYALFEAGEYAAALQQIEAYAELNPSEPNPLDSLAEMYLRTGQPERAIEYYTEAGRMDPTWTGTPVGRTTAYAMLGRYREALAEFEVYGDLASALGYANSGYQSGRAMLLAMVGRNDEAGQLWREELAGNQDSTDVLVGNSARLSGAGISLQIGDYAQAVELGEAVVDHSTNIGGDIFQRSMAIFSHAAAGIAAVHLGDFAVAREHLGELEGICDREIQEERWYIDSLKGEIELAEGRPAEAETSFRAAEPEFKMGYGASVLVRAWGWNNSSWRDGAARALRAQGDLAGAITEYRQLLTPSMTSKFTSFLEPRYVLELARLLDETGDAEAARVEYERFAELWKDADPELQPLVEEARQRAAELAGS